jgi:hypothetical protein
LIMKWSIGVARDGPSSIPTVSAIEPSHDQRDNSSRLW